MHHLVSGVCATVCAAPVTCLLMHVQQLLLSICGCWQQVGQWACTLLQLPCAAHAEHTFTYPFGTILLTKHILVGAWETPHCLQTLLDHVMASVFVLKNLQSKGFVIAACKHC